MHIAVQVNSAVLLVASPPSEVAYQLSSREAFSMYHKQDVQGSSA